MKAPIRLIENKEYGSKEWKISSPYFDKVWLEIGVYKKWFEFRIKMIYTPSPYLQAILGDEDIQEIFVFGIYLPFLK